jgi:hypothetical protein
MRNIVPENALDTLRHREVAYMPLLDQPLGMDKARWALIRPALSNGCIAELLGSLKQASREGIRLKDPWSAERRVFSRLMSYVADEPEVKLLSCIKGAPSEFPCEMCLVRKQCLAQLHCTPELSMYRFQ